MNRNVLVLMLALASFNLKAAEETPLFAQPVRQVFEQLRCKKEIISKLEEWKSLGDWTKHLTRMENQGVFLRTPGKDFGSWIGLDISGQEATLELTKPLNGIRVSFLKDCKIETSLFSNPADILKGRFTDVDLLKYMNESKTGLVYTWSPNMPWSIQGIKEIKQAAKELNVPVKIFLSSGSDQKLVKDLLDTKVVAAEDAKEHASLELTMRGMTMHDPSLIWFKEGRLQRWARPGHETSENFVSYLKREL